MEKQVSRGCVAATRISDLHTVFMPAAWASAVREPSVNAPDQYHFDWKGLAKD
jgi:hypothetical protein